MKQITVSIDDELHAWPTARATEETITLEQLAVGLLVTEKGEQHQLPDGRSFMLRAQTYRSYQPLVLGPIGRTTSG